MDRKEITGLIKKKAIDLGFDSCGIAQAKHLDRDEIFLKDWLDKGLHATMHYMENYAEKRVDPTKLVPGAKSVISVLLNYFPEKIQPHNVPIIAKYAYGKDYHLVIKEKLKTLLEYINVEITPCSGRFFTDSAPVLDRAWAAQSGLGWIGKNTNLIVPRKGSYFFIGELIVDIELEYNSPVNDYCGSCTKCINACPTNALVMPYILDSNRCISYHTIESKDEIPENYKGKFQNRVFGCDICQDVCPWNKYAKPTSEANFKPKKEFMELSVNDWESMDEELFNHIFSDTPVARTGFNGLKINIDFIV